MKSTRPNLFSRAARDCVSICAGQATLFNPEQVTELVNVWTQFDLRGSLVNEIYFASKQLALIAVVACAMEETS
jgi:hypothetical protein